MKEQPTAAQQQNEEELMPRRKKGLAYEWNTMPKWVRIALLILCAAGVLMALIQKVLP